MSSNSLKYYQKYSQHPPPPPSSSLTTPPPLSQTLQQIQKSNQHIIQIVDSARKMLHNKNMTNKDKQKLEIKISIERDCLRNRFYKIVTPFDVVQVNWHDVQRNDMQRQIEREQQQRQREQQQRQQQQKQRQQQFLKRKYHQKQQKPQRCQYQQQHIKNIYDDYDDKNNPINRKRLTNSVITNANNYYSSSNNNLNNNNKNLTTSFSSSVQKKYKSLKDNNNDYDHEQIQTLQPYKKTIKKEQFCQLFVENNNIEEDNNNKHYQQKSFQKPLYCPLFEECLNPQPPIIDEVPQTSSKLQILNYKLQTGKTIESSNHNNNHHHITDYKTIIQQNKQKLFANQTKKYQIHYDRLQKKIDLKKSRLTGHSPHQSRKSLLKKSRLQCSTDRLHSSTIKTGSPCKKCRKRQYNNSEAKQGKQKIQNYHLVRKYLTRQGEQECHNFLRSQGIPQSDWPIYVTQYVYKQLSKMYNEKQLLSESKSLSHSQSQAHSQLQQEYFASNQNR